MKESASLTTSGQGQTSAAILATQRGGLTPAETLEVPSLVAEIQREFRLFNLEKVIHEKADPLAWWVTRKAQYPLLATLARRVLAVPATSVNAERLFSSRPDLSR